MNECLDFSITAQLNSYCYVLVGLPDPGGPWTASCYRLLVKTMCCGGKLGPSGCTQQLSPFGRVSGTPPSLCPFFLITLT